jgi:hypothetical protein
MCHLCSNIRAVKERLTNETRYIRVFNETIECSCGCRDLKLIDEKGGVLLCKCEKCEHYLEIKHYAPLVEWARYIPHTLPRESI